MGVRAIDLDAMRASAEEACRLMKAMSNPDRLLLLCHLSQGEKCVGELEALSGIMQPTLSQQLAVLREQAIVRTRREGKNIFYAVDSPQALALLKTLYKQYC